mgnify:CR=1 FL=1
MRRGPSGRYERNSSSSEEVRAFIPVALPPEPPLAIDTHLQRLLERAMLALGRLDGVSKLLPDKSLFLYSYVRKEAVLSSQIEGTQSSLSDLLLFELHEAAGVPLDDVVEVSNYVAALEHGVRRIREGFPLSNRLIREIHGVLLSKGLGSDKDPGQFRKSQNWLGGSRPGNAVFVPPPPAHVQDCMGDLESFLHADDGLPLLTKAGLAHVQFETIHPFLDGNGRVGRLLVTLLLCHTGVLHEPLLYLSLYLKENRPRYYELLDLVRRDGDWEAWLEFLLEGVRQTADNAVATAHALVELFARDRGELEKIPRRAGSALRLHEAFKARPILSVPEAARLTGLTFPTAASALKVLIDKGIARELTGKRRNRLFAYDRYLARLNEGTTAP